MTNLMFEFFIKKNMCLALKNLPFSHVGNNAISQVLIFITEATQLGCGILHSLHSHSKQRSLFKMMEI